MPVHRGQKASPGILSYFSVSVLSTSLSLNLKLAFSQLDWQSASPNHPAAGASLGAEVTGMHKVLSHLSSPLNLLCYCCCSVEVRTQDLAYARKTSPHSSFIVFFLF